MSRYLDLKTYRHLQKSHKISAPHRTVSNLGYVRGSTTAPDSTETRWVNGREEPEVDMCRKLPPAGTCLWIPVQQRAPCPAEME
eukprot:1357975-Amorphochlora_amoeboformis.AAC.2